MASFDKSKFVNSGDHLMYNHNGEHVFIARFKHRLSPITRSKFKSFLLKNKIDIETFLDMMKSEPPFVVIKNLGFKL